MGRLFNVNKTEKKNYQQLTVRLNYTFRSIDLLRQALTHRSASNTHNERLEFLGDAILGLLIAEFLYEKYPEASEGTLSRLRASLVNRKQLTQVANALCLFDLLILGPGEKSIPTSQHASLLGNAVEALIAALYLDSQNMQTVKEIVLPWFMPAFSDPKALQAKDSKSQLQEWLQARQLALPVYRLMKTTGQAHQQAFTVQCSVLDETAVASALKRRYAEQEAARLLLKKLKTAAAKEEEKG